MTRIIGGNFSSLRLKTPKGSKTRPTQDAFRELVFNLIQHSLEDACFLDLCAGSGAIGLEALSRGAKYAYFVDQSLDATRSIKENIDFLKVNDCTKILRIDAQKALKYFDRKKIQFSHIYIDPPYEAKLKYSSYLVDVLLKEIDELKLLLPGGVLIVEEDMTREDSTEVFETFSLKKVKIQGKSKLRYYIS